MENNTVFTRIQLKYDSYTHWTTNNPTLLEGEVAIAKLVTTNAVAPGEADTQAPVLFKVGPGAFNSLPWVSGLAADVYAWAKKSTPDWTDFPALPLEVIDNGTGRFVTDFTYADNKLTITRSDVAWTDVQGKPDFDGTYKKLQNAYSAEGSTVKTVTKVEQNANGEVEITYADIAFPEAIDISGKKDKQEKYEQNGSTTQTITKVTQNENGEVEVTYENIAFPSRVADANHADAAGKVDNAFTVKVGGADVVFDGSAAKTADVDSAISAAMAELGALAYKDKVAEGDIEGTISKDKITNFATEVAAVKVTEAAAADKVAHKLTAGSKQFDGSADVEITAADFGLESAMHFVGALAEAPNIANPGDVYLNTATKKEYVYSNDQGWVELGDEGSHALKTIKIEGTGYLTGGGDLSADRKIDIDTAVKTKIDNGATAFGWGDHAKAGYAVAENLHAVATSGSYKDLKNLPTLGALAAKDKITETDIEGTIAGSKISGTVSQANQATSIGNYVADDLVVKENFSASESIVYKDGAYEIADTISLTKIDSASDLTIGSSTGIKVYADSFTYNNKEIATQNYVEENYVKTSALHKVATSGNIADLDQTAGTYIIFNCGTSTTVI